MHENYDLDLLLELVEQRKFRSLKELLSQMNEVDIAEFLDELDVEQEILVFRLLPKDVAAEVFTYLETADDQEKLIGALSDRELREVLDELYLDDTVDIIEDMMPLVEVVDPSPMEENDLSGLTCRAPFSVSELNSCGVIL